MAAVSLLTLALAVIFAGSCGPRRTASAPDVGADPAPVEAPVSQPATGTIERVPLEVPGFLPAVLSLPDPSAGPRPVVVIGHGAGDRPEWQCEFWEVVFGGRALVLCLRGAAAYPRDPETGYYFKTHYFLEKLTLAAITALERAHPARIAPGPKLYIGFSQGAIMGALFAAQHGDQLDRLVLIEGGFEEWDHHAATRFAKRGGRRVLFACGHAYCARQANDSATVLRRVGVDARVEHIPGGGHTYGGEVGRRVVGALDWVTSGDARWQSDGVSQ